MIVGASSNPGACTGAKPPAVSYLVVAISACDNLAELSYG